MKRAAKSALALLLTAALCGNMMQGAVLAVEVDEVPAGPVALAEDAVIVDSGTCGENLTWTLDSSYVLTISGTGAMTDWSNSSPWYSYRSSITAVVIESGVTSIGARAFYYCTGLSELTIPEGVTAINDWGLIGCSGLTSVTLPDSLTSLGERAFQGCSSLTELDIPDGVTSIGGSCFYNCTGLTKLTIPAATTSIGTECFYGCASLTEVSVQDGNTAFAAQDGVLYNASMTELILYPANKGDASFQVPGTVTEIGQYAFAGNTNLNGVTLPDGLLLIDDAAFWNCTGLAAIAIPDGVRLLGVSALNGCSRLTSVTLPESIAEIQNYTFYECSSLSNIVIPDGVEAIGSYAFYGCTDLTAVQLGSGVSEISRRAFWACPSLTSLHLPAALVTIKEAPFVGCTSLRAITVDSNNRYFSAQDGVLYNKDQTTLICYPAGKEDTAFTVPGTVQQLGTSIYSAAFAYNDYLKELTIADSVTLLSEDCFAYCHALESVDFGSGLITISQDAFWDCTSLREVVLPDSLTSVQDNAFYGCTSVTSVTLGRGLEKIYSSAFCCGASLTSMMIPSGVTLIEDTAVGYYVNDTSDYIRYRKDFVIYGYEGTMAETYAEQEGFTFVALEKADIAACTVQLEKEQFPYSGAEILPAVTVTDGSWTLVENVDYVVSYSDNIEPGTATVTIEGMGAYTGAVTREFLIEARGDLSACTVTLSAVSVPYDGTAKTPAVTVKDGAAVLVEGVDYTVSYSDNINPGEATVLITGTGDYINSLTVTFRIELEGCQEVAKGTCGENLVWLLDDTGRLTIGGTGAMTDWANSASVPWYSYRDSVTAAVLMDGAACIGSYGFYDCTNLTSVTIPASVSVIGSYAFENCTGLTELALPTGLTEIRDDTFSGCSGLTSVTIPDSVTSMGISVFQDCEALTSVTFGSGAISLGNAIFSGCTSLTDVTLGGVTSIGSTAFSGCTALTGIVIPGSVRSISSFAFLNCSKLRTITFVGDSPEINSFAFFGVRATAYYPADNATWTAAVMQSYGGNITWEPYETPVENPFPDISTTDYYYDAVLWAAENGITTGRTQSDGTVIFMPNDYCTRAQAVTFLWRAMGEPEPATKTNPFTDISTTDYYYKAVLWAYETGITTGKNPGSSALLFGPNDSCTRAQIVTFLWRAEGKPGHTISNPFPDVADGGTFTDAILWAYENGVTTGRTQSDGTVIFMPNDFCTRAQIVTFLYRDMVE